MNSKGVTLIEVLITVTMIVILLSASFWGYKQRGRELELNRSVLEVISNIEKVREMAMSGQTQSGSRPEGGFGIHFVQASGDYVIFVDANQNKLFDSGEEIETLELTEQMVFSFVSPSNPLDIVFIPPSPDVFINTAKTTAEIVLNYAGNTKKITVNSVGLIYE